MGARARRRACAHVWAPVIVRCLGKGRRNVSNTNGTSVRGCNVFIAWMQRGAQSEAGLVGRACCMRHAESRATCAPVHQIGFSAPAGRSAKAANTLYHVRAPTFRKNMVRGFSPTAPLCTEGDGESRRRPVAPAPSSAATPPAPPAPQNGRRGQRRGGSRQKLTPRAALRRHRSPCKPP